MPRYPTIDEWVEAYDRENPLWEDRGLSSPGGGAWRYRKDRLLCDEQLEAELIDSLRAMRGIRVLQTRKGSDDRKDVWNRARREGAIVITADDDFWDERKHPTSESPGLILVNGAGAEARLRSFVVAWHSVVREFRQLRNDRDYLLYTKIKATPHGRLVVRMAMRDSRVAETAIEPGDL
jgi:Domain of unknown function (DUF5615)